MVDGKREMVDGKREMVDGKQITKNGKCFSFTISLPPFNAFSLIRHLPSTGQFMFLLIIYTLLFPVFAVFYLISFFFTQRRGLLKNLPLELKQRFGILDSETILKIAHKNAVWIHAASVGEVKSLALITENLKNFRPNNPLFITTSTHAGRIEALKLKHIDAAFIAPLDFYPLVSGFIKRISPSALILVETELWPAALISCAGKGIKIAVINGRISQKSASLYKAVSPLMRKIMAGIPVILAQTENDAERFKALGAPPETITVTGNIKYDIPWRLPGEKLAEVEDFLAGLGWKKNEIFTAGSTHPVEEEMAAESFMRSKRKNNALKFIIAPRHPERCAKTAEILKKAGIKFLRWSARKKPADAAERPFCLLLDEIGWLGCFYSRSFASYVGGTFIKKGGHNLLEPANCGVPVLFGENTQNIQDAADMLMACGGGFKILSSEDLSSKLELLINNPPLANNMGESAKNALKNMQGATKKTLTALESSK